MNSMHAHEIQRLKPQGVELENDPAPNSDSFALIDCIKQYVEAVAKLEMGWSGFVILPPVSMHAYIAQAKYCAINLSKRLLKEW